MNDNLRAILDTMLNAEVTLQTASDSAQVPGTLARQARRDARVLSEAIALLKLEGDKHRAALAAAAELLERKDKNIEQLTTQLIELMDEINRRERIS